jgi:Transposase IS116/IS110/IS902 family
MMNSAAIAASNPLFDFGVGIILALVLRYDIHDIHRCPRVQDCVSYCRLVKGAKESAGKRLGTSGKNIGHASRKWALSEAAVLFLRNNEAGQKHLARLAKKHDQGKALTVLAHNLARVVYDMRKRHQAFETNYNILTPLCTPAGSETVDGAVEPYTSQGKHINVNHRCCHSPVPE